MPSLLLQMILIELTKLNLYELKHLYSVIEDKAIISGTKSNYDKWLLYIKCMIKGFSLRKTAVEVGISLTTAFYWRDKILKALHANMGDEILSGIVEAVNKSACRRCLDNYLDWFKWLKLNKDKKDFEKVKSILINTIAASANFRTYDCWNQKMLFS